MASTQPNPHFVDDLIRAAEAQHEHHVRTLRSLQDGMTMRRIDSQPRSIITIPEPFTPPLRALTFTSDAGHAASISVPPRRRTRASTLETTAERPAMTPEIRPLTNSPGGGHSAVFHPDDDVNFIPLLDPTSASIPNHGRYLEDETFIPIRRPLTPMHFPDDELLRHLRDTDFTPEMARLLDDAIKRRGDIDLAMTFRDFAAYEREGYVQSTFEVYEVGRDSMPIKLSADVDIDLDGPLEVKYTGDGPYENAPIVDAPTVWEAIGDVNPDAQSVGRITYVYDDSLFNLTRDTSTQASLILLHFLLFSTYCHQN